MGSDRARVSYDPRQEYRSVVMQQGRVTLESDWNEAQQITSEEMRRQVLDLVGPSGTPDNGYQVAFPAQPTHPPFDFLVREGVMYVGGLRTALPQAVQYGSQPDWLDAGPDDPDWVDLSTLAEQAPQDEFVYLFLREQEVSAVEDPNLKDVALGGPDTAQRTRLLQRVMRLNANGPTCARDLQSAEAKWQSQGLSFDPATMRLSSDSSLLVTFSGQAQSDPCQPVGQGGYVAPDNQLIRAQISGVDAVSGRPKFLWGFDDASFLYRIDVDPNNPQNLILQSAPVDADHQPSAGQAVEILRSAAELPDGGFVAALSGFVATLDQSYQADSQSIILPAGVSLPAAYLTSRQSPPAQLFLRIWEQEVVFTPGTAVPLGDTGVQVTLQSSPGGTFHPGDYWLFALRPATPQIVYPERYQNAPQLPDGPRIWACPLGVIGWTRSIGSLIADCRNQFDNLVDLSSRGQGCCRITIRPQDVDGSTTLQSIVDKAAQAALRITAADPGAEGNNIAITISNLQADANPAVFDLTATETDFYPGLTIQSIESILGDEKTPGSTPGLAHVLAGSVVAGDVPATPQTVTLQGAQTQTIARADIVDVKGNRVFTLQAKKAGTGGNFIRAIISNPSAGAFDLTLLWTSTLSGVSLGALGGAISANLSYLVAAPDAAALALPSEGIYMLSGGINANPSANVSAAAASAVIFGNPSTICLQPGAYRLSRPLLLQAAHSNLTIEACGGGVTLSVIPGFESEFADGMIVLTDATNVKLSGLTLAMPVVPYFETGRTLGNLDTAGLVAINEAELAALSVSFGVRLVGCQSVGVENCVFLYPPAARNTFLAYAGIFAAADCSAISVERNSFAGPPDILAAISADQSLATVAGYVQSSTFGQVSGSNQTVSQGTLIPSSADDLSFRENTFRNLSNAVALLVPLGRIQFAGNRIQSCMAGILIFQQSSLQTLTSPSTAPADAAALAVYSSVVSDPQLQRQISVIAAIPLPASYQPARLILVPPAAPPPATTGPSASPSAVFKVSSALATGAVIPAVAVSPLPVAPVPVTPAPVTPVSVTPVPVTPAPVTPLPVNPVPVTPAPVVLLQNQKPFTAAVVQFLNRASTAGIAIGVAAPALTLRFEMSANDIDAVLGAFSEYALFIEGLGVGMLTMTGNRFSNKSPAVPAVLINDTSGFAITGNLIWNLQPAVASAPAWSVLVYTTDSIIAAVTGNIFRGAVRLPSRFPRTSPPDADWITYNTEL